MLDLMPLLMHALWRIIHLLVWEQLFSVELPSKASPLFQLELMLKLVRLYHLVKSGLVPLLDTCVT